MEYQLRLKPGVEKELSKLPQKDYDRVIAALAFILKDPLIGKKLRGECSGCYSYRVWPYRIIYKIYKDLLLIVITRVGHRQGVY